MQFDLAGTGPPQMYFHNVYISTFQGRIQACNARLQRTQHLQDVLRAGLGLVVAAAPVVAGAAPVGGQEDALRVEQPPQVPRLHPVYHPAAAGARGRFCLKRKGSDMAQFLC